MSDVALTSTLRVTEGRDSIAPYRERHSKSLRHKMQKQLLRDEVFQAQVMDLANHAIYPTNPKAQTFGEWLNLVREQDADVFQRLRTHAEHIAGYWGMNDWHWIIWLAVNPISATSLTPSIPPSEATPHISPWVVEPVWHRLQQEGSSWKPRYVQIILRPHISGREATRAIKTALKFLSRDSTKGQPSLPDDERRLMTHLFEQYTKSRHLQHGDIKRVTDATAEALKSHGIKISHATLKIEYRKYLSKNGYPKKPYTAPSQDVRASPPARNK